MSIDPEMQRRAEAKAQALARRRRDVGELEPRDESPEEEAAEDSPLSSRDSSHRSRRSGSGSSRTYKRPVLTLILFVAAGLLAVSAIVILFQGQTGSAILPAAYALFSVALAQILDHVARTSFDSKRTVELLERAQRHRDES
ncbi:MAG: hypothetical protein V4773_18765 [Verrucomicrobiota bacterium]